MAREVFADVLAKQTAERATWTALGAGDCPVEFSPEIFNCSVIVSMGTAWYYHFRSAS